ncbi:hypothetical protein AWN76_005640 [Rhodothermaceae bacterium RA]|nr:hypothetical protein AWN76_005640 [Rhodothermaceae bacterium RA]
MRMDTSRPRAPGWRSIPPETMGNIPPDPACHVAMHTLCAMRYAGLRLLFLLLLVPAFRPVPDLRAQDAAPLVVMNLAAHPDDEDGRTLAYYRYAKNAIAYSVIFTRGEGGQNEIGPELYEDLGALRTEETLQAARILGTQVYFLNFKDFGFSKHAAEAFEAWGGRDAVTARLVYLIRKLKPDVLFTNHDTVTVGPRRQHGQHQAVGLAAYDAMTLAADPTYHPEQLQEPGVSLWQPHRLFLRHWSRPEAYDVAVPVGAIDPDRGRSYSEIAMEALREHASQGMGMFAQRRLQAEATYFSLLRSATAAPLAPDDLAAHLPPNTAATPDLTYWIDAGRLPDLPEGTLHLDTPIAVPGQRIRLSWDVAQLPQRRLRWEFSGAIDTTLYLSDTTPGVATLHVPTTATPTLPRAERQYDRWLSHPPVWYTLYRAGTNERVAAGYLPLEIAPALTLSSPDDVVRLRPGKNPLVIESTLYDPQAGAIHLNVAVSRDADRTVLWHEQLALTAHPGHPRTDTLRLTLPDSLPEGTYTVTVTALPDQTTAPAPPARLQVPARVFDVAVPPGLRVGVVQSYDDALARALTDMGIAHVLLDSLALAKSTFDDLHTIVIDIRAYLVRPDLRQYNDRLLDWVARGGHLVVNYQKTFEWNPDAPDPFHPGQTNPPTLAPYPIVLSRDRVTYETAPVTLLVPDHVLFQAPNAITPADWDGWVQERGLYFPRTYDARYLELFSMHDPGEPPLRGSTLLASVGRGTYLYTALVWYRQLKVFHPGAYRLFANLISLPLVDGRAASPADP